MLVGEAGAPEGSFYDQAYLEMGTDYGANDEISSLPTIPLPTCPSEEGKLVQGWSQQTHSGYAWFEPVLKQFHHLV